MGTAGLVDVRTGGIAFANELMPGWTGQPVAERLSASLGLPVAVLNDVKAHALGEARWGAARGAQTCFVIAAGTGLGGGIVAKDVYKRQVYTYDPEKAKSLLSEAGVTDLSFELMTNNNWVKNLAAGIKNDLDAIGVNCTINETKINWASLAESADVLPYDVMLTPGDPTCFGNDPDLLMSWWYGDNVWTQGRSCWKKAGDGKFDELQTLMQQAREATGNEQQELWNKCFDLLAEEVPLYPLFHRELATGYQETQITGFEPIATTGLVFLGASVKA